MKTSILSFGFYLLYLFAAAQPKDSYILYKGGPTLAVSNQPKECTNLKTNTTTVGKCNDCAVSFEGKENTYFYQSKDGAFAYFSPLNNDIDKHFGTITLETTNVVEVYSILYQKEARSVGYSPFESDNCFTLSTPTTSLVKTISVTVEEWIANGSIPSTIQTYCDSIDFSTLYNVTGVKYEIVSGPGTISASGFYRPTIAGAVMVKASKVYDNGTPSHSYSFTVINSNILLTKTPNRDVVMGESVTLQHNHSRAINTAWDFGDQTTQNIDGINIGTHYYYSPGKKTIKVLIRVPSGCEKWLTFNNFITVLAMTDIVTDTDDPRTAGKLIKVYPVPTQNLLFIETKQELRGTLTITSLAGINYFNKEIEFKNGINEFYFENIPAGIYLLEFKQGHFNQSFKIIKH